MSTNSTNLSKTKTDFKSLTGSSGTQKKIDSPLAKYNSIGQLTCIICNQVVKTELLWNTHLNSKSHLENKNQLKMKLIAEQAKPLSSSTSSESKTSTIETKSSVNSNSASTSFKRPNVTSKQNEENEVTSKKQKIDNLVKKTDSIDLNKKNELATTNIIVSDDVEMNSNAEKKDSPQKESATVTVVGSALPEGFFDDPELDAKARGFSRAENLEAEFEEFKKVMQAEEFKSDQLVEKDDTLRDIDRDLEEVDELINRWTKIENLHQRREEILNKNKESKQMSELKKSNDMEEESSEEESDIDLDSVLGLTLRSKKRC